MTKEQMLQTVTAFYLRSSDFNGLPLSALRQESGDEPLNEIKGLILSGHIAIVFGDAHPNPHIRALPEHHSPAKQVELLDGEHAERACAYPLPEHLNKVVNSAKYASTPYTLALMLGEPQLTYRSFDLVVLETYRNDPRYHYDCNDIQGKISVRDDYFERNNMPASDQVLLQTFGFSYDNEHNKYVAAFLRYLAKLSPEHQRLWHAREVSQKTRLHPDYYRSSITGQFPESASIYVAFIEELRIINEMARSMGRVPLFRNDYATGKRPREFASLLRPTAREYANFVLLLDKLVSENIDIAFFRDEVPFEHEKERPDGKVEVKRLGSLHMLSNWLALTFQIDEPQPVQDMLAAFRRIRKLRQKSAHVIDENNFDQSYIHAQRDLMKLAYNGILTLRLILESHPCTKAVRIPTWLKEGKIWAQ